MVLSQLKLQPPLIVATARDFLFSLGGCGEPPDVPTERPAPKRHLSPLQPLTQSPGSWETSPEQACSDSRLAEEFEEKNKKPSKALMTSPCTGLIPLWAPPRDLNKYNKTLYGAWLQRFGQVQALD